MPGKVDILLNEDTASYKRLYLYNENTQKWQYLNSYADGVVEVEHLRPLPADQRGP